MKLILLKDYKVHKAGSEYQTDDIEAERLLSEGYANQVTGYMAVEIPKAQNKMVNTRKRKIYKRKKSNI